MVDVTEGDPRPAEPLAGPPGPKPAKPRVLQDGRDMFWSLIPLVAVCVLLAGLVGMCSFGGRGSMDGPAPTYDAAKALTADAAAVGFAIRLPRVPDGWQANSGSRIGIESGRTEPGSKDKQRAIASRVGYIAPSKMYMSVTQSDADETALVQSIQKEVYPTGAEDVDGVKWIVYQGGEGTEPVWTTRLDGGKGPTQVAITGAGTDDDFRTLAIATQTASPLG
ncbi:MAG: DUF4245 domain-containing protein [Mycobacterium sp.]